MYSFKDFYSGVLFSDICTLTFVLFWMQATFCSAASFVSWPREAVLPTTIHHSTSRQRKNVSFTTVPFTDFCVCVTEQHSTKQTMTIDTLRLHTTKNTMTTSSWNESTQSAQTLPRPLQCRPLVSDNISYKMSHQPMLWKLKKNWPQIHNRVHQNLTTSRRSALVHAYHVWLTSVNAFVSYPIPLTERLIDKHQRPHNFSSVE